MISEQEIPYPQPMLTSVDYQIFDEDFEPLVELEHGVLVHYKKFLEKLELALLDAKMIQVPELIVAHLCCYLGSVTTIFDADKAEQQEPEVVELVKQHADFAFSQFNQYPVNSSVGTQQEKKANLSRLRENSPGSIVVQTMRLGRVIMEMMERLKSNRGVSIKYAKQKQEELFCPQNEFFALLIPLVNEQHHEWQETLSEKSINCAINQLAIQVAWLIGYFSHLDEQPPSDGRYLANGLPCITMFREHTQEFLNALHAKGQTLTSMQVGSEDGSCADPHVASLLDDVHALSSKTHADLPPATTKFQKDTAIVQAGIEKLVIELMMDGMAIKVIIMSVFYFWFTLDAPLRVEDPSSFEGYSPFEEMGNIIQLVKSTANALPKPTFSKELKLLNAKMEALKSNLPHPSSLDDVPEETVPYQSNKVNTAIHTLISDYIKQDYHVEIIANILFNQWMRLSVLYGVSESDWQKMDYYFVEILTAVREYIPTILNR